MMKFYIEPGKYVVAVSGGVDSVVLLDLLYKQSNCEFIVAHFDHGIREDSVNDRKFVQDLARNYGLQFEYKRENLGPDASEEVARTRRYKFLESAVKKYSADAIVTAHHKDDLLETAVFNLLRGTARSGLTSLRTTDKIIRPLLDYRKAEVLKYAKQKKLVWCEDPTNLSTKYTRNKIRKFLKEVSPSQKGKLEDLLSANSARNLEMDQLIEGIFSHGYDKQKQCFDRSFFVSLPHKIACELMVFWLKELGAKHDKKRVEKLVNELKTLKPGAKTDIDKNRYFEVTTKQIGIQTRSSV